MICGSVLSTIARLHAGFGTQRFTTREYFSYGTAVLSAAVAATVRVLQ